MGPQVAALISVLVLLIVATAFGWHSLLLAFAVCGVLASAFSALAFVVVEARRH
jgi:hypothetical protein